MRNAVSGLILAALILVIPGSMAAAQENYQTGAAPRNWPSLNELFLSGQPQFTSMYDPFYTTPETGPLQWYYFKREKLIGSHLWTLSGGSTNLPLTGALGDPLATGMWNTSIAYRYEGILGGFIRPVARFTVGGGQYWLPSGDRLINGYVDGMSAYAMPEAGVEFVYHGKGIGMTVSYPVVMDVYHPDADITGFPFPPRSQQNAINWDQLLKNIYIIWE